MKYKIKKSYKIKHCFKYFIICQWKYDVIVEKWKINDDFRRILFKNNNKNVFAAISANIDQFDIYYFIDNDFESANLIDNWKFYAFHMSENDFETVVLSSSNLNMNEISNFVLILNFWCDKKISKKIFTMIYEKC